MSDPVVFDFEEVDAELSRPPIAAQRAFLSIGVMITSRGWRALSPADRRAIAVAGSRGVIDQAVVQGLVSRVPIAEVKLCAKTDDPDRSVVPPRLQSAIGSVRPISTDEWERLTSLDRYMLNGLSSNPRLLWRALQELAKIPQHPLAASGRAPWARVEALIPSDVARAEVRMAHETVVALMGLEYLDGRAFVLARAAGRRVARATPAIYDLHAEDDIGPVDLDWAYEGPGKSVVWQAHASRVDGSFAAAASLGAAAAAALCLVDMVRDRDRTASVVLIRVAEEPWTVGTAADEEDSSTAIFKGGAGANIARLVAAHRNAGPGKLPDASQAHDPVAETIRRSGVDLSAVPEGGPQRTAPHIIPAASAADWGPPPASSRAHSGGDAGGPRWAPVALAGDVPAVPVDPSKKARQEPTEVVSRTATDALVAAALGHPLAPRVPPPMVPDVPDVPRKPTVSVGLLVVGIFALVALLAGIAFLLLR